MSTGKSNQKLTRKKVNRETVDYMKVSMESDENLLLTESFPPTIKKPSTLLSTSVHSSFSSSSSRSSSSSSTSSAITTIRNDDKSLTGNENVDNSIGLRLQSTGTIKSRKPRLFRQPNALMDTSPNQPSASSSSHGDNLNPLPSSSTINDSSTIRSTFRPVPQVSVTLSSPDNPFDDSTIEFIDSDYEQQQSSGSPVNSDNLVTINQTNSEKIRNHLVETNKMESNENSNIGANSVETNDELNVSQESGGNINGPEGHSIGSVGGEGRSRTRYLTRTLALLKLQYLRKSRSEDTGDQETRNIRRLSERPTGLIGDPMIPSTHLGHHLNHHHASIANKSLSSASLCGSSLATSPPSSLLGPSLSKGDSGERGGNGNNIHPSSGNYLTGSLVNGSTSEPEPYILGIHVHNTDRKLKSAKSVVHPVVKIHIIDTETSSYLIKKHSDRDVAFYYETGNSKNNFILPVMTQNCDMLTRIRYPRYPIWEELLLYNEDYSHFLSDNVIIFFEILDFLTFSGPSDKRYNSMKRTEWWYRIAWAFLSLKSSDGSFNTGRKLRLQLYKPISQKVTIDPKNPHTTELFEWWKNQKLITFPGSIYVTVSPIPLIVSRETFCPSFRSYGPFQPETNSVPNYQQNYVNQTNGHFPHNDHHHHHHFNQGLPRRPSSAISNSTIERSPSTTSNPPGASGQQTNAVNKSLDSALELRLGTSSSSPGHNNKEIVHDPNQPIVIWNRLEGAPCKIPKNLWHQFSAGNNKCSYAIKFSWDGRKVACGASVFTAYRSNEKRSSIFIYEIPSGRFMKRVNGFHSGAIYEIDWSPNDKYLVSASSDCTAHVWNNVKEYQSSILLPHPCFVYTARFHVTRSGIVFTGSYDGLIRIWCIKLSLESTAVEPQLVQEIDCFYGQVLSLAWKIIPPPPPPSSSSSSNSNIVHSIPIVTLFASGSKGEIVTLSQRDVTSDFTWYLSGSIKINEIIEVPVNNIVVHPQSNKILICCRDGVQRMIDYQLELIVQRFTGSLNFHHLIRGCLSPCGRFVFAGGEDSLVHCWNADTGEKLFTYNELPFKGPISCVEFHPLDNILAICGLNARTISVCLFNHELPKVITPKPIVGKSIQSSNMITASSSSTKQGSLNDSINSLTNNSKSDSSGKTSSRFELLRSKTIDQSNNVSESGAIRRGNFKVQRAMRRLEFALRTKSIDKR